MRAPDAGAELDVVVPDALEGQRCDRAIAMLLGQTRSHVASLIAAGEVTLNDRVCQRAATPLRAGDRLRVGRVTIDEPVAPEGGVVFAVVCEGEDFVVVDKPAGLVVHPGAGQREGTLVAGLLARFPEIEELREPGDGANRPGIVHRLDKGTSGLLVVARTARGLESLRAQLVARTVRRVYAGAVEGVVDEPRGVVDAPIGRSPRDPLKMAVRTDGRSAQTDYEVIERLVEADCTTLQLTLRTGRTHQIRVHLAAIGHPILNDERYGRVRPGGAPRPFLHAARLEFRDPRTDALVVVTSPVPPDLAACLPTGAAEQLSRHVVGGDDGAIAAQDG